MLEVKMNETPLGRSVSVTLDLGGLVAGAVAGAAQAFGRELPAEVVTVPVKQIGSRQSAVGKRKTMRLQLKRVRGCFVAMKPLLAMTKMLRGKRGITQKKDSRRPLRRRLRKQRKTNGATQCTGWRNARDAGRTTTGTECRRGRTGNATARSAGETETRQIRIRHDVLSEMRDMRGPE